MARLIPAENFHVFVNRVHETGESSTGSAVFAGETLSLALERAFADACFLMGTGGARVEIKAYCRNCSGAGVVGGTARRKGGKCKACKGAGSREVASFLAEPPKECEIWRHGARVSAPQQERDRKEAREERARVALSARVFEALKHSTLSVAGLIEVLGLDVHADPHVRWALRWLVICEKVQAFERGGVEWFEPIPGAG